MELTDTPLTAYVSGYGSRQLLTELRGRPPVWASRRRAWLSTEATARDLVAVAESRGWGVTVTRGPDLTPIPTINSTTTAETAEVGLFGGEPPC